MKKILFGTVCLLLMASCSGKTSEGNEDSSAVAGSVAQAGAYDAEAEQARLGSLRQDSIKKAEEFSSVVKALEFVPEDKDKIDGYLKDLGFNGSKTTSMKTEDYLGDKIEIEVQKYYYTLTMGDKTIVYSLDFEDSLAFGSSTKRITIDGDEEALDSVYQWAKMKDAEVTKQGNTVIIKEAWA